MLSTDLPRSNQPNQTKRNKTYTRRTGNLKRTTNKPLTHTHSTATQHTNNRATVQKICTVLDYGMGTGHPI